MRNKVLFEDNHLIAVQKYPSDIIQGDKTGDKPLSEIVKDFIKERDQKPGNVYLGVIHRIDRPVSGVIVFAKTSKALARMNKLFQDKKIQKTYLAVLETKPKVTTETLTHFLLKNQKQNKSYPTNSENQGKKSSLTYTFIGESDRYYLVKVDPHTGRHHQIRCQLSNVIGPIKGDLKYGAKRPNKDASIHLHAFSIRFIHPIKNEELIITCETLPDPLWDYFQPQIKSL